MDSKYPQEFSCLRGNQRANFVGRQFDTITRAEFNNVFNNTYYPEQVCKQKGLRVHKFEVIKGQDGEGISAIHLS